MQEPGSETKDATTADVPPSVGANAVVSYNLRAIRGRKGWTQTEVARRLADLTGQELPQASISAMERGFDRDRRRRFDAHDLYLLSVVFDVPIAYFFLPPPNGATEACLANTGQPLCTLYAAFLGHLTQLPALDERLAEVDIDELDRTSEGAIRALFGATEGAKAWDDRYQTWREEGLRQLQCNYADRLVEAADVIAGLAARVKALSPEAYLSATEASA